MDKRLAPLMSSGQHDERTPDHIIERAIGVMGGIDLDPCAEPGGPPYNVSATDHYALDTVDGLTAEWRGKVYMNPPYGRQIGKWIAKLLEEVKAGRVEQAVCLLPSRTDTRWMRLLESYARCYIYGRLKFKGHENGAPFPSVVVYVANSGIQSFIGEFRDLGACYWLIS